MGRNRRGDTVVTVLPVAAVLAIVANHVGYSTGRSLGNDYIAAVLGRLDVGVAVLFVLAGFVWAVPLAGRSAPRHRGSGTSPWRHAVALALPLAATVVVAFLLSNRSESLTGLLRNLALVPAFDGREFHPDLQHLWIAGFVIGLGALLWLLILVSRLPDGGRPWMTRHPLLPGGLLIGAAWGYNLVRQ